MIFVLSCFLSSYHMGPLPSITSPMSDLSSKRNAWMIISGFFSCENRLIKIKYFIPSFNPNSFRYFDFSSSLYFQTGIEEPLGIHLKSQPLFCLLYTSRSTLKTFQILFRTTEFFRNNTNTFIDKFCCFLRHLVLIIIRIDIIHLQQLIDKILAALYI